MILKDKVVAVCGVGPGLGREIAQIVLRDGGRAILGARNVARLDSLAAELDPSGDRVAAQPVDINDPASCEAFTARGVEVFGRLDAVVGVAALESVQGGLFDTSPEDWERALRTNVVGNVNLIRAAADPLAADGGGAIVLIGSQATWLPPAMPMVAYGVSKGALLHGLAHFAEELGPRRIRINTVVPTYMWGPPVEGLVAWKAGEQGITEEEYIATITENMPLGEIPADEDIAEAVAFFCSDRSRMITGQSLLVNAGELIR